MALIFPWNTFDYIKINNNEIFNSIAINIHLKYLYDNAYYLNTNPRLDIATTLLSGTTQLATSAEIAEGIIRNKAISTSAFNSTINGISNISDFESLSMVNITDNIKYIYGEFDTLSGGIKIPSGADPFVQKVDFGDNAFSTTLLNFMLYPQLNDVHTEYPNFNITRCYRYLNQYDNTDSDTLSSITLSTDYDNPLKCAYIVYYNPYGDISKIKWAAIGI